jgi:rod shape-determining protein MreD
MNRLMLKYIWFFLLLLTADIFIVSRVTISVYMVPHIYPLFILLLPVRSSKSLVIALGFLTGVVMDLFLSTGGLHAAATTLIALLRIFLLPVFLSPEDYDNNNSPGMNVLGQGSFLMYTSVMIAVHHFTLYFLEAFEFSSFFFTLMKALISSLISVALIWLIQLLTMKKSKTNARRNR